MKLVTVSDLWPGDVVKLRIGAPEFRVVDIDGPVEKLPDEGAFPYDTTVGYRLVLSQGGGLGHFEVLVDCNSAVWRLS